MVSFRKYFCFWCNQELTKDIITNIKPCSSCGRAPLMFNCEETFPPQGPGRNKVVIEERSSDE